MTDNESFGLRETNDGNTEGHQFRMDPSEWLLILGVICAVTGQKASASLYTSRDGNALAVAIKAGTDRKTYWIGPNDNAHDKLHNAISEWGIHLGSGGFAEFLGWVASEEGQRAVSDE
jgi:hypothetical protein